MLPPSFTLCDPAIHRDVHVSLNIEYMEWVLSEIERTFGVTEHQVMGMSVTDYVSSVIDKICGDLPPRGVFYLINVGDEVAGMCGLRFLRTGVAEIKRLYVRPAYRGMHLGEFALHRLLSDAQKFGYRSVCLDTAPFMKSAHRLYESQGFVDCAVYEGTEVPPEFHSRWRFMERSVSAMPRDRLDHS